MILASLIIMAAAAAGGDDGGIVASGTVTVGASIVTGILTYLATKRHTEKTCESVRKAVPNPLEVELKEKFVTREEFDKHVDDNTHDHENIFNRLTSNDKSMGEIKGMLSGMREDLSFIKGKFFKR